MLSLLKAITVLCIVIYAELNNYGIEFVIILCAVISFYILWASTLKPEILMYMAGMPNHLVYSILIGGPMELATRTLALATILVPVYILCP